MFQKKYAILALVLVLSMILVAGCAGTPASEEPAAQEPADTAAPTEAMAEEPAMEPVTITYLASQDWIKDAEMDLAAMFEEETGIHVDFQIVPSDQYFNVLTTKLNSGEGPDIFGGQSGKTDIALQLNVAENAVPLTDEEWVQRMNPLSTDQLSLDGVVYGLTIWDTLGGSWVVVYNKDIFAQYDLSVPTTYEEFKANNQILLDAGITPVYEPIADGWHHVLWFAEIGPAYEAAEPGLVAALNANETTFAESAVMLQSLEQFNETYRLGYFGQDALSNEYVNTEAAMASGDYAMTVYGLGLPALIESAYPEVSADSFGFFLIPLADNQIWNVNPAGPSKFIYSGSEHIDAAKAYFEFLTRPENLQYMLDNVPQFSLLNFDGVEYELTAEQQVFVDRYPQQGTVLQTAVNYFNPQWMDVGQDLVAMFTGTQTAEGILSDIDQTRAVMATTAEDPAWK